MYWNQSLEEPLLIAQLLAMFNVLRADGEPRRKLLVAPCAMSFLSGFVEWTSFVVNALFVVYLLCARRVRPEFGRHALATALAGALIVAHFALSLGMLDVAKVMLARIKVRSFQDLVSSTDLFRGYATSFGAFMPLALAGGFIAFAALQALDPTGSQRAPAAAPGVRMALVVLALSAVPLAEHVLLMPHAVKYSFDPLKFAVPLGLCLAFVWTSLRAAGRRSLAAVWLLIAVAAAWQNVQAYHGDNAQFSDWSAINVRNRALVAQAAARVDLRCALLGSDGPVRGYTEIAFGRSLFENAEKAPLVDAARAANACATVLVNQETVFDDIPRFRQILIVRHGSPDVVLRP
ncbi:hypothetical protein AWB78_06986 [Caballeronia calidae]|uniref:Uncharacterized protein n=1 Tax=Caballeronia calidae TaxID=1777139 RepID=A0A158EC48_9BURK|nr:hypothetical protein [Caballeronia calidae]SAL04481.1 hypothetical protein AWB78_06986 [Caballeronia calidae]